MVAASELYAPDDAALTRAVWPRKDGKNWHASIRCFVQFPKYFVVSIVGCAMEETDLKFLAARMLHNVQVSRGVSIKNRYPPPEEFRLLLERRLTEPRL